MHPNAALSIDLGTSIPIKIMSCDITRFARHWHPYVELVYVLSGQLEIVTGERTWVMSPDQILLLNPYEFHACTGASGKMIVFQIDLSKFDHNIVQLGSMKFDCNSHTASDTYAMVELKRILAQFIKVNTSDSEHNVLQNKSMSYLLLHHLSVNFQAHDSGENAENKSAIERIDEILTYTNAHYAEGITLKQLAEHYYLTVPYMSKIFHQYIGTTFTDYIEDLRLSHVMEEIGDTAVSIERLAEKHGFANVRSLVSAFRAKHNMSPSQYRRAHTTGTLPQLSLARYSQGSDDLDFAHTSDLGVLAKYLTVEQSEPPSSRLPQQTSNLGEINVYGHGAPLHDSFRRIICLGKAKHILTAQNQRILQTIQQEVGFEYLGFHGMLDDDMMLYSEDVQGNMQLSFTLLDEAFDFLRSVHLRPILELSFMPKMLACEDSCNIYYTGSVVGLPKDINQWSRLIDGLFRHLIDRYGLEEVRTWPIYLWNTPDSSFSRTGLRSFDDYFPFYKETYKTVKAIDSQLRFGTPNLADVATPTFLDPFLKYAVENGCMPDFLATNFYSVCGPASEMTESSQLQPHIELQPLDNAMYLSLTRTRENCHRLGVGNLKLLVCEWNLSVSHRELLNDTCYKACYITKNLLENHNMVDGIGYWVLSDLLEEVKLSGRQFHGGLGLFSSAGIKKAAYHPFPMLAKLGKTVLAHGDGYFITSGHAAWTRSNSECQIILYNYQHFSNLYASGELFDMTATNRYTPFDNTYLRKFTFTLTHLEAEHYLIRETIVNREWGSSFDKWVELGAEPSESKEEDAYLAGISAPGIQKSLEKTAAGTLSFTRVLAPHEVRLIEVVSRYSQVAHGELS